MKGDYLCLSLIVVRHSKMSWIRDRHRQESEATEADGHLSPKQMGPRARAQEVCQAVPQPLTLC